MRRSGPGRRRAFTLVELLVALFVLGVSFAFAAQALVNANRAAAAVRTRDAVRSAVVSHLERARLFGCGFAVASTQRDLGTGFTLGATHQERLETRCRVPGGNVATDADWVDTVDGRPVAFSLRTRWRQAGADPDACFTATGSEVPQPVLLVRTVQATWTQDRRTRSFSAEAVESVPPDAAAFQARDPAFAALAAQLVQTGVPPGTPVTLVQAVTGARLVRHADELGCAWFPYLEPGTFTLRVGDAVPVAVTLAGGETMLR